MKSNSKALAERRDAKTIIETLKQFGLVARLCVNPPIFGLMVSRPQTLAELSARIDGRLEPKELVDALRRENIFEGTIDDFARRRTAERNRLAKEAAR